VFAKALLAFLALPGVVAFAVPVVWLVSAGASLAFPFGLVPLAVGTVGLLWCVRDFYVSGKGTLAPWAPPERLVVVGLYRFSRNPMYVSVSLILVGWAASFGVPGLWAYAACIAVAFHLRVVLGEEPWLARTHGAEWQAYAARVPRWFGLPLGRRRP
jgi:protein-S-isoprenylcysteine O-methyltransferase Ste14